LDNCEIKFKKTAIKMTCLAS